MEERGEVFDRLWDVLHAMQDEVTKASSELDLTPMQAMLLDRLGDEETVPMSALARQLHCDKSNLTSIVDALESRGLAERTTPASDRRVRALVTTARGREGRARLRARLRDQNPLLARLDDAQTRQLLTLLRRLLGEE